MKQTLIAVATYGSQRVKNPRTQGRVSAYKIGYTGGTSQVLLAVFSGHARDVSSKRASYHYIHIDQSVDVKQGYILLRLTDEQIAMVETITCQHSYCSVYIWRDDAWWTFPSSENASYQQATGRSPAFHGTGLRGTQPGISDSDSRGGILVEVSQLDADKSPWHWLSGDTYPHRDLLKRAGCRWSKRRKSWYFIGTKLPSAIQALLDEQHQPDLTPEDGDPCSIEEASAILGVFISPKTPKLGSSEMSSAVEQSDGDDPCSIEETSAILGVTISPKISETVPSEMESPATESEAVPSIRVIKPMLESSQAGESDVVLQAIRATKSADLRPVQVKQANSRNLHRISQALCGEMTGSITGNVWAYGWAIHDGICVYLNCAGPRMAVEAIRAKLARGEIANCVPWDAPTVELTAGEGNTGMYTAFLQNIPSAKFTSLILVHESICQPNYNGDSVTHIFHISDEQAMTQLRHHITKLVKVPVFPEWTSYLWHAGQTAMLLRSTRTGGDVKLWTILMDETAWTRLITGGLAEKIIVLPTQG